MTRVPLPLCVLLALIGVAVGLKCQFYQERVDVVLKNETSVDCGEDAKYCYKYVASMTDTKGKHQTIYKGCSGVPQFGRPSVGFGIGDTASCDKDGQRAQSSGTINDGSYDDALWCCDKDSCNSAESTGAGIGLCLMTVAIAAVKLF
ncbi:hypothetical protein AAVH_10733 [Aphelenchoides avenae]|nr:hypothetical protein AAVH_10733 [Aphelenchus avenae]